MDFEFLGWPADGPTLDLDHRQFSYAGKFVMSGTGKAVVRDNSRIVGAIAFDEDRTDPTTIRIRYVTVRTDRRGEGLGPQLVSFCRQVVRDRGYERLQSRRQQRCRLRGVREGRLRLHRAKRRAWPRSSSRATSKRFPSECNRIASGQDSTHSRTRPVTTTTWSPSSIGGRPAPLEGPNNGY
ncbi:MAG: GNAT family N-acetyltransferase [Natrialbaceae archaeon]|nr:GNAT family N-acetyltransferase [Natrialbaceae archaeon]